MKNIKRGQIWIETVLYTLIGLALIGIVLAIATPKINQERDRILVEQSIESLNVWDERILELTDRGPGNVRNIPSWTMKKGELTIDGVDDKIIFVIDGMSKPYSEVGYPIREGNIILTSYQGERSSSVELVLDYQNQTNITYLGNDDRKKFTATTTPYSFSIRNLGGTNIVQIDIQETSRG